MIEKIYRLCGGVNKGRPFRFPNYNHLHDYNEAGVRDHHMLTVYWITNHLQINRHVAGQAPHNDNIHTHNTGFFSIVLKGSYIQEIDRVDGKERVTEQIRWFNWMPRTYRHRIVRTNGKPCWTIMVKNPFKKFETSIKAYARDNSCIELPIKEK
tara:strand:+ start:1800 stop:2261 length:462 start_codon:yes stop_codon:yes gene_type:complete